MIDDRVRAKVDRIGTGGVRAVVEVRVEHLHRHGFPAAGRAAVDEARPAGAECAIFLFQIRNELGLDRCAVRAEVRRVDGVGVVVEGIRVLDLDDQHARKIRAGPELVEPIRLFLLRLVVALPLEALTEVRLQIRIGRRLTKSAEVLRKMTVIDDERIARVRMSIEAFRQRARAHRDTSAGPRTASGACSGCVHA